MRRATAFLFAIAAICLTTAVSAQYPYYPPPYHPPHHPPSHHHEIGPVDVHNETQYVVHIDLYDSHGHERANYNIWPNQQVHFNVSATSSWSVELAFGNQHSGHRHSLGELRREGEANFDGHEWHVDIDHHF